MKKVLLLILIAVSLTTKNTNAQCSFTPTVLPGNIIFCPNDVDTLSTQVYDSYQWFKNGKPIAGAINRTLVIHQQEDQGYFFKVAVTKNGCKDTSKKVSTDGYAFSPPILIEGGDLGIFNPKIDALQQCREDTVLLTLGGPYSINIQWYNNAQPIPNATHATYQVTKTGSYTVKGSPQQCPNLIACECLPLNTYYETPVATITEKNDTLFASAAKTYQWYIGATKIAGATQPYYVPKTKGAYRVSTVDKYTCTALSDPFYFKPSAGKTIITVAPNPVKDVLHIHLSSDDAKQIIVVDLYGNQKIKTTVSGTDLNIPVQNIYPGTYVVQVLNSSGEKINAITIIKN